MSEPLRRPIYDDQRADYDDDFAVRRTPWERARRLVFWPAISFIAIGSVGVLGLVVAEALLLWVNLLARPRNINPDWELEVVLGTLAILVGIALFVVTIAGGVSMLRMRRRWLGLFAAYVVTGLALAGCYAILFFPFGIWGLVVLYRPDVRRAFDSPESTADQSEPG